MLAQPDSLPRGDYANEVKWDGFRAIVSARAGAAVTAGGLMSEPRSFDAAAARISGDAGLDADALRETQVEEALRGALETGDGSLVAAALNGYAWLPMLDVPMTFADAFAHPDPEARMAAIPYSANVMRFRQWTILPRSLPTTPTPTSARPSLSSPPNAERRVDRSPRR